MTAVPSPARLAEIEAALAKGTADGEWRAVDNGTRHGPENRYEILDDEGSVAVCSDDNDATATTGADRTALIVAAVNAAGPLIEIVREFWNEHNGRTCDDRTADSHNGVAPCPTRAFIAETMASEGGAR